MLTKLNSQIDSGNNHNKIVFYILVSIGTIMVLLVLLEILAPSVYSGLVDQLQQ